MPAAQKVHNLLTLGDRKDQTSLRSWLHAILEPKSFYISPERWFCFYETENANYFEYLGSTLDVNMWIFCVALIAIDQSATYI